MSIEVQRGAGLADRTDVFEADGWEIDPEGRLHLHDGSGKCVATLAKGAWDVVQRKES